MEPTILQYILLGIIQGITEWLSISSSASIILVMSNFYGITDLSFLLRAALFLHLGTFFAALIYFRKDIVALISALFNYRVAREETQKILSFLFITTLITGVIGLVILKLLSSVDLELTGKAISFVIGFFLLITGVFHVKVKRRGFREPGNLNKSDSVTLGLAQGLASLPGISRSGITVSTLLLKKFDDTSALRLSFLMSLPIVLIGNIVLNVGDFALTKTAIYGLIVAFVFGLATIHGLMKLAEKVNFGWFVLIFAVLMMASAFV